MCLSLRTSPLLLSTLHLRLFACSPVEASSDFRIMICGDDDDHKNQPLPSETYDISPLMSPINFKIPTQKYTVIDLHSRSPLSPPTHPTVCFIHFSSSLVGKSSRACAPLLSCLASALCMVMAALMRRFSSSMVSTRSVFLIPTPQTWVQPRMTAT